MAQASGIPLGDIAQLVERLLCKQEVRGSIPRVSTQVRGPFRSSEGASFMPAPQQSVATGFTSPLSELVAEELECLLVDPDDTWL